jgi:hypothetical protein
MSLKSISPSTQAAIVAGLSGFVAAIAQLGALQTSDRPVALWLSLIVATLAVIAAALLGGALVYLPYLVKNPSNQSEPIAELLVRTIDKAYFEAKAGMSKTWKGALHRLLFLTVDSLAAVVRAYVGESNGRVVYIEYPDGNSPFVLPLGRGLPADTNLDAGSPFSKSTNLFLKRGDRLANLAVEGRITGEWASLEFPDKLPAACQLRVKIGSDEKSFGLLCVDLWGVDHLHEGLYETILTLCNRLLVIRREIDHNLLIKQAG